MPQASLGTTVASTMGTKCALARPLPFPAPRYCNWGRNSGTSAAPGVQLPPHLGRLKRPFNAPLPSRHLGPLAWRPLCSCVNHRSGASHSQPPPAAAGAGPGERRAQPSCPAQQQWPRSRTWRRLRSKRWLGSSSRRWSGMQRFGSWRARWSRHGPLPRPQPRVPSQLGGLLRWRSKTTRWRWRTPGAGQPAQMWALVQHPPH